MLQLKESQAPRKTITELSACYTWQQNLGFLEMILKLKKIRKKSNVYKKCDSFYVILTLQEKIFDTILSDMDKCYVHLAKSLFSLPAICCSWWRLRYNVTTLPVEARCWRYRCNLLLSLICFVVIRKAYWIWSMSLRLWMEGYWFCLLCIFFIRQDRCAEH